MIKKYRNYLLGVIGILLTLTIFAGVKYLKQPKYEEFPEVKLKEEINNNKSFAIMISNDGNNYYEYENDNWPGSDYAFKEAKCTDNNGALVENAITFEKETAILETDQTVYCTLYFFRIPEIVKQLREKDKEVSDGIEHISSDLQGGMYRYQGTNNVPNWICFGTSENCALDETDSDGNNIPDGIDKYMYRIIGITPGGELYLIKETFLKEESGTSFTWNDKYDTSGKNEYTCDDKICPEWNTSLLFKRINGTSNGEIQGTGSYINKANTDIFVDSSEYEYLKSGDSVNGTKDNKGSEWYQLIANHEWMYGDTIIGYLDAVTYTGDIVYAIETGNAITKHYVGTDGSNEEKTYRWNKEVKANGKISLMYIHDYVYSYYDGREQTTRGNPGSKDNGKNSWIHFQKDGYNTSSTSEWLSTRWGVFSANNAIANARGVDIEGGIGINNMVYELGVRPVFYLTSNAKISSGSGTKSNPFILDI